MDLLTFGVWTLPMTLLEFPRLPRRSQIVIASAAIAIAGILVGTILDAVYASSEDDRQDGIRNLTALHDDRAVDAQFASVYDSAALMETLPPYNTLTRAQEISRAFETGPATQHEVDAACGLGTTISTGIYADLDDPVLCGAGAQRTWLSHARTSVGTWCPFHPLPDAPLPGYRLLIDDLTSCALSADPRASLALGVLDDLRNAAVGSYNEFHRRIDRRTAEIRGELSKVKFWHSVVRGIAYSLVIIGVVFGAFKDLVMA